MKLADYYPRFTPTMEWDTAVGQAINEQAGFEVLDLEAGKRMLCNRDNLLNDSFVVRKK